MNKQDIINFLINKPGYLKEGAGRLALKLNANIDDCYKALKEVRQIFNEKEEIVQDYSNTSNLVLKSKWQIASGEWRESYKSVQEDNLNDFKQLKSELLNDLKQLSKVNLNTKKIENITSSYALEVNLPDFHFGKSDGLSITQQAELYVSSIKEIIEKAKPYEISRIILPLGNDMLNSEGMRKSTTKGTPQDDNSDWKVSFRVAWMSVVASIELLAKVAPVQVVMVLGNHDFERSFYLGELLDAAFANDERITVLNNGMERNYLVFGKNLLAYTHGDKIKQHDLPLIMATEVPMEFAQSTVRSWRLGHLHKHIKDEYRGIEVEFLPALCGSDEWHRAMGYFSDRKAMAYLWDFNGGKAGFIQINK